MMEQLACRIVADLRGFSDLWGEQGHQQQQRLRQLVANRKEARSESDRRQLEEVVVLPKTLRKW